jgi:hypothetical protein
MIEGIDPRHVLLGLAAWVLASWATINWAFPL